MGFWNWHRQVWGLWNALKSLVLTSTFSQEKDPPWHPRPARKLLLLSLIADFNRAACEWVSTVGKSFLWVNSLWVFEKTLTLKHNIYNKIQMCKSVCACVCWSALGADSRCCYCYCLPCAFPTEPEVSSLIYHELCDFWIHGLGDFWLR